ncbi:MAG: PDZ domain-containing protein [Phycisphaerales bacterium]|nr:PDZ domain-containing protein [Phycisphaerales bacterium]
MTFSNSTTASRLFALTLLLGATVATANACQSANGQTVTETKRVVTRIASSDDKQQVELRIENGNMSASVNGEAIDASRVRKTEHGYEILAADGSVMKSIAVQAMHEKSGGKEQRVVVMRQLVAAAADDENNENVEVRLEFAAPVMIGVQLGELDEALCSHLAIDASKSTLLVNVMEGLPAAKAGLQKFDVVVGVGEGTDGSVDAIRAALASMKPGETMQLKIRRGAETLTKSIDVVASDVSAMAMPEELEFAISLDGEEGEDGEDGVSVQAEATAIFVGPDGKPIEMKMPKGVNFKSIMPMARRAMAGVELSAADVQAMVAQAMEQAGKFEDDGEDAGDAIERAAMLERIKALEIAVERLTQELAKRDAASGTR